MLLKKYLCARAQESQCKPSIYKPHLVTIQHNTRTVEKVLEKAKGTMQDLGMADFLKEYEDWNNPPIPGYGVDVEDDQDDDDDGEVASDNVADLLEVNSTVEPNEVSAGITQLSDPDLIDEKMADHLKSLHNASFRKISNNGLPVYEIEADLSTSKSNKCKFCSFVKVDHNNKKVFIHKTTAVWVCKREKGCLLIAYFMLQLSSHFQLTMCDQRQHLFQQSTPLFAVQLKLAVCVHSNAMQPFRR